jgi:hypothetical protein
MGQKKQDKKGQARNRAQGIDLSAGGKHDLMFVAEPLLPDQVNISFFVNGNIGIIRHPGIDTGGNRDPFTPGITAIHRTAVDNLLPVGTIPVIGGKETYKK